MMNPGFPTTTLKRISAGLAALFAAVALLTGCFATENQVAERGEGEEIAVRVRMGVGSVSALHKTALIKMDKLVIQYISSANETITDTITASTTPALDSVSTTAQTVVLNRSLKALRSWKIVVTSRDRLDSVIHKDSASIPAMYAGDTAVVNLNLSSRFTMYEAKFLSLPDSIQSSVAGQPKQALCINRLVLKVDGVSVRDSVATTPCFATTPVTHTLAYDYVTVGNRTIQLLAYGPMNAWNVNNPLFSGSTSVNAGAGVDATVSLNLAWVGPATGTGQLDVQLGRVGKVTVIGTLPGTIP
jgi:hypothetical protein